MNEQRKVCAEFLYEDRNCPHAKIVEENGEYPVITFQAKEKNGTLDPTTIHNVKTRVDTKCWCVYCTHPNHSKEKFIGSVEPYFSCYAPSDCPELQKSSETLKRKPSFWQSLKKFFINYCNIM